MMLRDPKVLVIGAGMGGLASAIDLARQGIDVTVLERGSQPGGKVRQAVVDGSAMDCGPTVFTMRWIFESLFSDAGASLDDWLTLIPADILARHAWVGGARLDLFADVEKSAAEIEAFSGARNADGYLTFCRQSAAIYETLRDPFILQQRPSQLDVVRRVGLLGMPAFLAQIKATRTLWQLLFKTFDDPRLVQLFARYATYVGSSPFATPATISLVAHVEQEGVWTVDGGMFALAQAMERLGKSLGVDYVYDRSAKRINAENGRACGVTCDDGEVIDADAIVFNGDISAVATGVTGDEARGAVKPTLPANRSLSAVTWCLNTEPSGFPLAFHNVFFADDYRREFEAVFHDGTICETPTVYLCAQDRGAGDVSKGPERIFLLINAPANGGTGQFDAGFVAEREEQVAGVLAQCGLKLQFGSSKVVTTPDEFHRRYPATGGALYGQTCHGMFATLARSGAATKLPGLYLTGGSVHPGPGVPMATMSGRLAASALISDLPVSLRFPKVAV
ncbi:MAG: 1-hydroxycarotenoid 3,4-desaturase CrtD [Pseudomonadota bacterium]